MTEEQWLGRVLETACLHGWRCQHVRPARMARGWRTPVQGHVGAPDLLLARDGVVLLAELKVGRNRLTPAQRAWRNHLGGLFREWRPENWTEVLAELSQGDRTNVR